MMNPDSWRQSDTPARVLLQLMRTIRPLDETRREFHVESVEQLDL
jgi:hypothetical protein